MQTFWPNGHLKADVTYRDDAYEGEYRTWYESGAPYELRHYAAGHETGLQQSWTPTGELYLNYQVRDGRRYGLVNAAPCVSVRGSAVEREPLGERRRSAEASRSILQPQADALPYYDDPQFTAHWAPVAHRIAPFTLTRQTGEAVTERDLEGRVHVASFIYTKCAAVCPILVRQLARVQAATGALIVSYSVTPGSDTPAALAAFGRERAIDPSRWWLVTGDADQIFRLARTSYFADDDRGTETMFLHTEKVLLVDRDGRLRGVYNGTQPREIDLLIADMAKL